MFNTFLQILGGFTLGCVICSIGIFITVQIIDWRQETKFMKSINKEDEECNSKEYTTCNYPITEQCIDVKDLGPSIAGGIIADGYKEKLDYIRGLIDDFLWENEDREKIKRKDYHKLVAHILCIVTNKTCSTCKWHEKENITDGKVCVNGDADECSNWTDNNFTCTHYEVDPEWDKLYGKGKEDV